MKIYENGWVPRDIAIKVDGATKFLGGIHDLLHTGIPQAQAAEDVARLHKNVLNGTYASDTTKLMCEISFVFAPGGRSTTNLDSSSHRKN